MQCDSKSNGKDTSRGGDCGVKSNRGRQLWLRTEKGAPVVVEVEVEQVEKEAMDEAGGRRSER